MNEVKGSQQYTSVVVPHQPGRQLVILVAAVVVAMLIALVSIHFAGRAFTDKLEQLENQRDQLLLKLTRLEGELRNTEQTLANLRTGSEVDRLAVDDIHNVLAEQAQNIASLTEEISFYKGLMAPADRERGLSIREWGLYSTKDPLRFQFKLLIQQFAVKHRVLSGSVVVTIEGREGTEEKRLNLADLSQDIDNKHVPLRFKYFQNIEGELLLPKGFEPLGVDLVAKANRPKKAEVAKHYDWVVKEN